MIKVKVAKGLITQNPRTPRFYTKPKIHKEGIPGSPVISSVNCHNWKISEYVDYHVQPIVPQIPSNIKDTSYFLCKLKPITEVPENSCLVTRNVKWLYISIPNSEGKKAVKISHENFTKKAIAAKVITTFLALILTIKWELSTNQRLCNGNYLCTILRKYIHAPFWAKILKSIRKSLTHFRYIDNIFLV